MGFDESDDGIVNHRGGLKGLKDIRRPLIVLGAAATAAALVVAVAFVLESSRRNSPAHRDILPLADSQRQVCGGHVSLE